MMTLQDLATQEIKNKVVLLRTDYNVPLSNGVIQDDTRIKASLPTIQFLKEKGAKILILSHLGRPRGEFNEAFSLKPVAKKLSNLLNEKISKSDNCEVSHLKEKISTMKSGDILLAENIRFHKEETDNNDAFSRDISSIADYFVQDAFGVVHRSHVSTVGISKYLPSFAGLLLEKEIYQSKCKYVNILKR